MTRPLSSRTVQAGEEPGHGQYAPRAPPALAQAASTLSSQRRPDTCSRPAPWLPALSRSPRGPCSSPGQHCHASAYSVTPLSPGLSRLPRDTPSLTSVPPNLTH